MADDADPTELSSAAEAATLMLDDPLDDVSHDDDSADAITPAPGNRGRRRAAFVLGLLTVLALAAVTGWLGWQAYQLRGQAQYRQVCLHAARQGALNLTTIDYREVNADIQRILDSTTGAFHNDFSQRSEPFIDTVKQAQSTSVGTITAAGLESVTDHEAQVLVAVSVKSSLAGVQQPQPRAWRMRINVETVGNEMKVSNVAFVP
ncbi:mammalian cell entry protein [Mycobacterium sp. Aquia_216]|uniref:mammalian cell entry protein n=1 Tax=Mycobacterium sp. Aquia_216 TaxID=2991729 RepID=UPI00227AA9F2|nr:mammalian cell entry protein [Mycobacterium sp. Aquia_216]WAJ44320.1 mammalian cell entry protein [Mycobacterium sp. Aquia_216]